MHKHTVRDILSLIRQYQGTVIDPRLLRMHASISISKVCKKLSDGLAKSFSTPGLKQRQVLLLLSTDFTKPGKNPRQRCHIVLHILHSRSCWSGKKFLNP